MAGEKFHPLMSFNERMPRQSRVQSRALIVFTCTCILLTIFFLTAGLFSRTARSPLLQLPIQSPAAESSFGEQSPVDWTSYAYVQYATRTPYICNSLMTFERLQSLGSKADRIFLHSSDYSPDAPNTAGRLLKKAREEYGVILKPIEVRRKGTQDGKRQILISQIEEVNPFCEDN